MLDPILCVVDVCMSCKISGFWSGLWEFLISAHLRSCWSVLLTSMFLLPFLNSESVLKFALDMASTVVGMLFSQRPCGWIVCRNRWSVVQD